MTCFADTDEALGLSGKTRLSRYISSSNQAFLNEYTKLQGMLPVTRRICVFIPTFGELQYLSEILIMYEYHCCCKP